MTTRRWPLTWCEISIEALQHNAAALRARLAPGAGLGAVVKSEAYGHGLGLAVTALRGAVDLFCVHTLDEALAVRALAPSARIVQVGPCPPAGVAEAAAAGVEITVSDPAMVEALRTGGWPAPLRVHLKVETGTHRQGLAGEALLAAAARLAATDQIVLQGLSTHFADIEDTLDHGFARGQLAAFDAAAAALEAAGLGRLERHCANSAATLLWPSAHFDFVRAGVACYGLWPSRETWLSVRSAGGDAPTLRPALRWCARVTEVNALAAGAWVGYGRTWRATAPTRLAVLGLGYADGYDRKLSNTAHALLDGLRAPVRGRVCMNLTMVDVTAHGAVAPGDVAVLLGADGHESILSEQLAQWMGTINYEVATRIPHDVPRIAVDVPAACREAFDDAGVPVGLPSGESVAY